MSRFDRISGRVALVLSLFALLIATGGVSYAAVKLARNSVTSATIKDNTITSADVRDHSLGAVDFKPGQLPAGARGPQGVPGVPGPAGPGAKLLTLTNSSPSTYPIAHGVALDWPCLDGGGVNQSSSLGFSDPGGTVLGTGMKWAGSAIQSHLVDQEVTMYPAIGGIAGFTGTVRNPSTNTAVWVDLHIAVSPTGQCTGSMAYMPLTPAS